MYISVTMLISIEPLSEQRLYMGKIRQSFFVSSAKAHMSGVLDRSQQCCTYVVLPFGVTADPRPKKVNQLFGCVAKDALIGLFLTTSLVTAAASVSPA